MKRAATVFVVVLCALALVSSVAFADQCSMGKCCMSKGDKMWGKKGHDEMLFKKAHLALAKATELGLTDDQVSKIKALEYNFKKSLIKEDADIKSLCLDIKEAITKDTVDTNAVNSLIDQKYTLKATKAKEAIQACATLKTILSKDQYAKLKDMCAKGMCDKMKHWGKKKEGTDARAEQEEND